MKKYPTCFSSVDYDFLPIKTKTKSEHVDGTVVPIYLSPNCEPLDKFYNFIDGSVFVVAEGSQYFEDIFSKEIYPKVFRPQEHPEMEIPNPEKYETFEAFSEDFTKWYRNSYIYTSSIFKPESISGMYYYPMLPTIFSKDEKNNPWRFKKFDPETWQLLPENYLQMLDLIYTKAKIDPEELFKEQVPKRGKLQFKHHLTDEDQWSSQHFAKEPLPFLYDSFKEYEEAYEKWANLTYDNLKVPPFHPKKVKSFAAIDYIQNKEKIIENKQQNNVDDESLHMFDWAPKKINSQKRIGLNLIDLFNESITLESEYVEPIFKVYGVNKQEFINDMIEYGIYDNTVESTKVLRPKYFIVGQGENDIKKAERIINQNKFNFKLIEKFLDYNFTIEQMKTIMNMLVPSSKSRLFEMISTNIFSSTDTMKKIFSISKKSTYHYFRISTFIRAFISNPTKTIIFEYLFEPANLQLFDTFIQNMNLSSDDLINLIPMISDINNIDLVKFNQLYLVIMFLNICKELNGSTIYQEAINFCHTKKIECAKIISSNDFIEKIMGAKPNDDYWKVLAMILQSSIPYINRLLFTNKFIEWSLTNENLGYHLLILSHTPSIYTLASKFVGYDFGKEVLTNSFFEKITENGCYFLIFLLNYLLKNETYLKFRGIDLLNLFKTISEHHRECVNKLLLPILQILYEKRLICDYNEKYQKEIISVCSNLCESFGKISFKLTPNLYCERIKALGSFVINEKFALEMIKVTDFINILENNLGSSNYIILQSSWHFIHLLSNFDSVLQELLKHDKFQKLIISTLQNDDNNIIRKVFEFSNFIYLNKKIKIQKQFSEIIKQSVGSIVCNYQKYQTAYKNDIVLQLSFINFLINIFKAKGSLDLIQKFLQHSKESKWQIEKKLKTALRSLNLL